MEYCNKTSTNPTLDRLLPCLLINYPYASGNRLVHGKMGGVLFFLLYSNFNGNKIYEDFADMLMKDIYEEFNKEMPVSFDIGLCGFGWSIEYLVQNGYIEGNTDDTLENIDKKIMEWDPVRISDHPLNTGLGGILFYVVARM